MLDWQGTKPGTFVNNSTIEPVSADNLNAVVNTLDKVATGGKNSGLDADTIQGIDFESLATPSDETLTNFYSFDSLIGLSSEILLDEGGLNINGQAYNVTPTKGIVGMAGSFNGTTSYATGPYTNKIALTMAVWFKGNTTGTKPLFLLKRANNATKIGVYISDGYAQVKFLNSDSVVQTMTDTKTINDLKFHHIAVVHTGIACYLYVDGIVTQSLIQSLSSQYYNQWVIGCGDEATPTTFTSAVLDDVRIYSSALSKNEIYGLFFTKLSTKSNLITPLNQANSHVFRDSNGDFSANNITADLIGNSSTSTKLETTRSITLSGDVNDVSSDFDGSANISLSLSVKDDSHGHTPASLTNMDDSHNHTISTLTGLDDRFINLEATKEYSTIYTYSINEPCFYLGSPYKSLQNNNTNKNPATEPEYWVTVGGGGSADGNIGYNFDNRQFETSIAGWNTYKDTAQSTPVDGTGGTATITFTRNSTLPLNGLYDGLLTKPASNVQGEGFSYDFTIDRGSSTMASQVSFNYKASADYMGGYTTFYIYDVTNATFCPCSVVDIPATFGTNSKFVTSFNPNYNSENYRFIVHISTSTTTAWTMQIDNVQVGQIEASAGIRKTPWIPYPAGSYSMPNGTPVVTTSGKVPIGAVAANPTKGTTSEDSAMYSEEGEDCLINVNYKQISAGSNAGNGIYLFALPLGKTIDLTKNPVGSICLNGLFSDGLSSVNATVVVYSSTTLALQYVASDPAYYLSSVRYPTTGANAQYRFTARVACAQQSINCVFNGINEPFYLSNTESTVNTNGVVAKTKIGIDGSPILANTTNLYYEMTLPRALLPNESPEIQVRSKVDGNWIPVEQALVPSLWCPLRQTFYATGIYNRGYFLSKVSANTIRVLVSENIYGSDAMGGSSIVRSWAQVISASDGFDAWRVRIGQAGMSEVKPSKYVNEGNAPVYGCRAWVNFDGTVADNVSGTYAITGTTCTVTLANHGHIIGHRIYCDFTSGTGVDGLYTITNVTQDTYSFVHASATTSGNVTELRRKINASGNVHSVAYQNTTGKFIMNISISAPNDFYSVTGGTSKDLAAYDDGNSSIQFGTVNMAQNSSSVPVRTTLNADSVFVNFPLTMVQCFW